MVIQCWGVRQGEGQRICRVKYLFTDNQSEPESESLYPSRTSFTRDTIRVGSLAHMHGWERIKGLKTLTTFRGPWGHTMILGQTRVGPKFREGDMGDGAGWRDHTPIS